MTTLARFCPKCGTPRVGAFRYCQGCRYDFDEAPVSAPPSAVPAAAPILSAPAAPASADNLPATLAGVAWLGCAGILAFLAYAQWSLGSTLTSVGLSDEGLPAIAAWNGLSGLLTAYFGARCLRRPDKGFLMTSVGWAVLNVVWGTYQVINGVGESLFVLTIVASGLAGVLSFAARDAAPASRRIG
jgi:hypothetical protein